MASDTTTTPSPQTPPQTPILILPKVTIRPYRLDDAPSSAHLANDPEIAKQMRNGFPHPYTPQNAEAFITGLATQRRSPLGEGGSSGDDAILLHYALCRTSDGAFVGGVGLKPFNDVEEHTLEVGYWVGREHWGNGYASEAVAGFSRWALGAFPDVIRLEAKVHEGNGASEAVLLRAGYRREGVKRRAVWKNGRALDLLLFGMLREECPGLEG